MTQSACTMAAAGSWLGLDGGGCVCGVRARGLVGWMHVGARIVTGRRSAARWAPAPSAGFGAATAGASAPTGDGPAAAHSQPAGGACTGAGTLLARAREGILGRVWGRNSFGGLMGKRPLGDLHKVKAPFRGVTCHRLQRVRYRSDKVGSRYLETRVSLPLYPPPGLARACRGTRGSCSREQPIALALALPCAAVGMPDTQTRGNRSALPDAASLAALTSAPVARAYGG